MFHGASSAFGGEDVRRDPATETSQEPKCQSAIIDRGRNSRHSRFSESINIGFNLVSALEVEQVLSGEFE